MSADFVFGTPVVARRHDLTVVSPPLPAYVHPAERRRARRARLRALGEDIPWDPAIDGDLVEAFFDELKAAVES